jgi:isopenicillin-N N-acyltransferase-like protein
MERLIGQTDRTVTLEDMKRALRDHENHPTSICRHVNDHPVTGYWATTFSVLMETETGLMHVSRGNPCEKPYETYRLT